MLRYKTGQIPAIGDGVKYSTYNGHGRAIAEHGRVEIIDASCVWVRFVGHPAMQSRDPRELELTTKSPE